MVGQDKNLQNPQNIKKEEKEDGINHSPRNPILLTQCTIVIFAFMGEF